MSDIKMNPDGSVSKETLAEFEMVLLMNLPDLIERLHDDPPDNGGTLATVLALASYAMESPRMSRELKDVLNLEVYGQTN